MTETVFPENILYRAAEEMMCVPVGRTTSHPPLRVTYHHKLDEAANRAIDAFHAALVEEFGAEILVDSEDRILHPETREFMPVEKAIDMDMFYDEERNPKPDMVERLESFRANHAKFATTAIKIVLQELCNRHGGNLGYDFPKHECWFDQEAERHGVSASSIHAPKMVQAMAKAIEDEFGADVVKYEEVKYGRNKNKTSFRATVDAAFFTQPHNLTALQDLAGRAAGVGRVLQ